MAIWTKYSSTMTTSNVRVNYRIKLVLNSQDIATNTSNVTVSVEAWRNNTGYTTYGSGTCYCTINGTQYSASIVPAQTITYLSYTQLFTTTINIAHNEDGTKSLPMSAYISHDVFSSSNQSYSEALDTIPRASLLNAFSMGGTLKFNTANTVNLTLVRYSASFTHDITLKLGTTVIKTWTGQGVPTSLSLTASEVNSMIAFFPNVVSGIASLTVQTKSGSTNIGAITGLTAVTTIDQTVAPVASALAVSIYGTGRDKTILKYVQNISKATASFSAAAGYGATVASTSIVIRRDSDDGNSQTISGTSGTTAGVLSLSGTYEAIATVTDSRSRTATQRITFTVEAYSPPNITNFTAVRNASTETTVVVTRQGNFTPLAAGNNVLTILLQKRLPAGTWTNVESPVPTTTAATFNDSINSTGNLTTNSYEFMLTITDSFGKQATSMVTVSTSKVVLSINKNIGVGIGKIHEQGVLDVLGNSYFTGAVNITDSLTIGQDVHSKDVIYTGGALDTTKFVIPNKIAYTHLSGYLIDLCPKVNSQMLVVEISGNGYVYDPINTIIQGYFFDDDTGFLNARQNNFGMWFNPCKFLIQDNRIKLWIPPMPNPFIALRIKAYGGNRQHYMDISVVDSADPTSGVSNKKACAVGHGWTTWNAQVGIELIGSNANGIYIKYTDGTLFQYGYTGNTNQALPMTFTSIHSFYASVLSASGTLPVTINITSYNTSSFTVLRKYWTGASFADASDWYSWLFIGRWK